MATPEPTDDAWRALQLQFDLVKHAETKAAATLASSGVLGGLLYSLVSQNKVGGVLFALFAALSAVAIVTAATAAGIALRPRQFRRHGSRNLLFYGAIADEFGHDAGAFGGEFEALLGDRSALLAAISGQILSNANVAARKYHAINVAIFTLLAALALMAVTAGMGLTGW
ncbi:Pycsar system effector family protein [Actinoplanes sp. NPDC023714]|uniref:Pycsar system effector family protein n=1 Tax=Actinoplanes sp. NPDC023714 TaxID=3154322 RepID=UPI0033FF3628